MTARSTIELTLAGDAVEAWPEGAEPLLCASASVQVCRWADGRRWVGLTLHAADGSGVAHAHFPADEAADAFWRALAEKIAAAREAGR